MQKNLYFYSPLLIIFGFLIYILNFLSINILVILTIIFIIECQIFSNFKGNYNNKSIKATFLCIFIIILSFLLLYFKIKINGKEILDQDQFLDNFTANIVKIEKDHSGFSIMLKNIQQNSNNDLNYPIPRNKTIHLSVHTKSPELNIGDKIQTSALLQPFSPQVIPSGYNERLVGLMNNNFSKGFTVSDIKIINKSNWHFSIDRIVNILRENIQKKIDNFYKNNEKTENFGLITAFLTGSKHEMPKKIIEDFRTAGVSHLLAISGLHLAIFSGWIFFAIKYILLIFFPRYYSEHNSQIPAAFFAILSSYYYLKITGSSISTERSFFMILIFYIGIIIQKPYFGKKSLITTMIGILIFIPQSILSAGFQMSFAGTASLFVANDLEKKFFSQKKTIPELTNSDSKINKIYKKSKKIIIIAFLGTILPTLFTAPFTIYNFHTFNLTGVFTNLIAIPYTAFFIMPTVIFAKFALFLNFYDFSFNILHIFFILLLKILNFFNQFSSLNFSFLYLNNAKILLFAIFFFQLFVSIDFKNTLLIFFLLFFIQYYQVKPHIIIANKNIFFIKNNEIYSIKIDKSRNAKHQIQSFFQKKIM